MQTLNEALRTFRGMHYPTPPFFDWPRFLYWLWRSVMCRREYHLLSEVASSGGPPYHYLCCEACGLVIGISNIDTTYSKKHGIDKPIGAEEYEASRQLAQTRHYLVYLPAMSVIETSLDVAIVRRAYEQIGHDYDEDYRIMTETQYYDTMVHLRNRP